MKSIAKIVFDSLNVSVEVMTHWTIGSPFRHDSLIIGEKKIAEKINSGHNITTHFVKSTYEAYADSSSIQRFSYNLKWRSFQSS